MKLNKKGFFKGVKVLSLIIVLLFTFLFSLGIRGNKAPLMANKETRINAAIPNSGYIENIYINKYRTTAQTIDFLNNVNLNYVINPMAEQTSIVRNDMYIILCNSNLSKALVILRYSVIDEGVFSPQMHQITLLDYTTMIGQLLFVSQEVVYEGVHTYSGWQISSPEIVIDSNLVSSVPNFNFPVGQQNNLLTDLFSINNVFFDSYSYNEGDLNGYRNGYDLGLLTGQQNGEEIGYENGYIDGQQYGEQVGYNIGYQEGYNDGRLEESPIGLEWFKSAISVLNSFLEIQLLPNVSIGAILSGFVILVLLKWILAWFRG